MSESCNVRVLYEADMNEIVLAPYTALIKSLAYLDSWNY